MSRLGLHNITIVLSAKQRCEYHFLHDRLDWRDGVVVRASASQSVDHISFPQVEPYQKTLINSITASLLGAQHNRDMLESKCACCVLGQDTLRDTSIFM